MRIAFVGKGGSGKSSVSWLFAKYLSENGTKVLAIDADYNMDLAHNLGIELESVEFVKKSEKDFYACFDTDIEKNAFDIVERYDQERFHIFPNDPFTKKYALPISSTLQLMVLGDHDEETMYSGRCSHAYAKTIKFYTPYLALKKDQALVIDSVAGTDMVNYGMYLGVDAIVCVVEDSKNSVSVRNSVQSIASTFGIPVYTVRNKAMSHESVYIGDIDIVTTFTFDPAFSSYIYQDVKPENISAVMELVKFLKEKQLSTSTIDRLKTWKQKHTLLEK
jgi:CO dehydrogenase maturation factor